MLPNDNEVIIGGGTSIYLGGTPFVPYIHDNSFDLIIITVQYQKIFSSLTDGLQALQMILLNNLQATLNLHPVSLSLKLRGTYV